MVGDEAREASLSEKASSAGGLKEAGLGGPPGCCGVIFNEVRSGQLRELLGDLGVSRITVVDGGGGRSRPLKTPKGPKPHRTRWRGSVVIRWAISLATTLALFAASDWMVAVNVRIRIDPCRLRNKKNISLST